MRFSGWRDRCSRLREREPMIETTEDSVEQVSEHGILLIISLYAMAFVIFGFWVASPGDIFEGLVAIITTRDALLTDYIAIGGMGATFVNAGLLTLCTILIYSRSRAKISGLAIAGLFLVREEPSECLIHSRWSFLVCKIQERSFCDTY